MEEPSLKIVETLSPGYTGKRICVARHVVQAQNGHSFTYEVGQVQDAVAILPVYNDNYIGLLYNYRLPTEKWIFEVCAGLIDNGEEPFKAAQRELKEEMGLSASSIKPFGSFYTSPGWTSEKIHCYLATGLIQGDQELEAAEVGLHVVKIPLYTAVDMIKKNQIVDAKTISLILNYYISQK